MVTQQKKINFSTYLVPYKKIPFHTNSCTIKQKSDLNIKPPTIKLLEEYIGEDLCDQELSKEFLETPPKHTPERKRWLDFIRM